MTGSDPARESGPPPVPGGRSPEERERARLEREARRAGRRGPGGDGDEDEGAWGRGWTPRSLRRRRERGRGDTGDAADAGDAAAGEDLTEAPPRRLPDDRGRARARAPAVRLALGSLVGLAALAVLWLAIAFAQPFAGEGEGQVRVSVRRGAGAGEIGEMLDRRGVVSSAFFFKLRATLSGRRDDLKPGAYTLRRGMSYGAALDALSAGPAANVVQVTLPEGRARRELAPIVRAAGLEGSYMRASVRSRVLDPRRYGAKRAASLEGFLFPATYEIRAGAPASALVAKQLAAFKRAFAGVDLSAARRKNLSPYDVLIIASMVEREAQLDRERPLVASVVYNRLSQGIPLYIDATIRFATNNWTRPLRQSELALDSPYNTRRHQGLPPGPIGNPGLESLRAAARPARTDYLYYVVKPGTCGEHAFSSTDAEFQRDSARYNAARAQRGGRSPTNCPP